MRSPVFDKSHHSVSTSTPALASNGVLSSSSSTMSSPESNYGTSSSPISLQPLQINYCPYSSSPYLDKYEEAENAVCSYSQELRAKLLKHHSANVNAVPDFKLLAEGEKKWKLGITSLEGGKKLKTLLASCRLQPNEAIIELVGKYQTLGAFSSTS